MFSLFFSPENLSSPSVSIGDMVSISLLQNQIPDYTLGNDTLGKTQKASGAALP
jgi:hypothetical protein